MAAHATVDLHQAAASVTERSSHRITSQTEERVAVASTAVLGTGRRRQREYRCAALASNLGRPAAKTVARRSHPNLERSPNPSDAALPVMAIALRTLGKVIMIKTPAIGVARWCLTTPR